MKQRTEIESSPSHNNRQMPMVFDLPHHNPSLSRVLPGRDKSGGLDHIKEMMRHAGAFCGSRLRSPDLKLADHGDRIAIDDFSVKLFGERQRERSFPARGGPNDNQQKRIGHGQRNSWWMELQ